MNITDAVTRADNLVSKYEKYITNEEKKEKGKSPDKFMDAYEGLVERITDLTLRSEAINQEKNRAQKAAQYAELRRAKAALLSEDLPALEKLVKKGKKITPETINDRASKASPLAALQMCGSSDETQSCKPARAGMPMGI
ncbi:g12267 [Coccomyxa viridis]|uniref:G12267 protein n=1 Tax=Coccomyxa viridis TaxID=1274662 RepID=A0ABP1G9Y3_9CHLO